MASGHYALVTTWRLNAPAERVWGILSDPEGWPCWWPFVEAVEQGDPGEADGLRSSWRFTWKTRLPYRLRFELRVTRIEAPALLEADVQGDLSGRGVCRVLPRGSETLVLYEWNVRTCRPWMQWLAPLARPVFLWNHRQVMRRGETALVALLDGAGREADSQPR